MDDNLLLNMEGRWYLQYTGSPLWHKEEIHTISFNYSVKHHGEELVLLDRVEYIRNNKMRFRLGVDFPVDGIARTFKWKGRGINRTFRKHFEVTIITDEYMVLFFEKTLTSPTSLDVVTRSRTLSDELKNEIFSAIEKNWTIQEYREDLQRIEQIGLNP